MNVIIPFHKGDKEMAIRIVKWIQWLGPQPGTFHLYCRESDREGVALPEGWKWLTDYLQVTSNWGQRKDASGPNSMWRQAAREMQHRQAGPWLWLEPDAVPCRRDWLTAIVEEYARAGKPFMGGKAPTGGRMSGVAIYAQETPSLVHGPFVSDPVAFDFVDGGKEFIAQAHLTELISDRYGDKPFKNVDDFNRRVPTSVALHHGDKTGEIYGYLRERLSGKEPKVLLGNGEPYEMPTAVETESFLGGMRKRLDWIIGEIGEDKPRRGVFYKELKARGIKAGGKGRVAKSR